MKHLFILFFFSFSLLGFAQNIKAYETRENEGVALP